MKLSKTESSRENVLRVTQNTVNGGNKNRREEEKNYISLNTFYVSLCCLETHTHTHTRYKNYISIKYIYRHTHMHMYL